MSKLLSAVQNQLKKDHSDWTEEQVAEISKKVIKLSEEEEDEDIPSDEEDEILVGENVRLNISTEVTSIKEIVE
jgi:hypothetical protein